MNINEFDSFLADNPHIEYRLEEDGISFRHPHYDKPGDSVKINNKKLRELTPDGLMAVLVNGRNVDKITRITGYFGKVSNFNKGKMGELKDRQRINIDQAVSER